jgi:hypothetical protein
VRVKGEVADVNNLGVGGSSRNSDLRVMKKPAFHQGVADALAGMPLREQAAIPDQVYYELGRLFAARFQALGRPVPTLPARGDFKRATFQDALHAFHQAMIVDNTFPNPLLAWFRQDRFKKRPPASTARARLAAPYGEWVQAADYFSAAWIRTQSFCGFPRSCREML